MEKRLQEQHNDVFTLYGKMIINMRWLKNQLSQHSTDVEYCADVAFAMNELDKLVKDVGVEIRGVKEYAEKLVCKQWMVEQTGEPIRTEHVTATPDIKLQPKMPRKGTPEMAALLDWIGVKDNHDVVRIHWPTLCEHVTAQIAAGKPLPDCLDSSNMHNPSATLKFYKRKDVTE